MGTLIGPVLKMVLDTGNGSSLDPQKIIPLKELIGNGWATIISWSSGLEMLTLSSIYLYLPFFLIALAFVKDLLWFFHWSLWERLGEKITLAIRENLILPYFQVTPSGRLHAQFNYYETELAPTLANDCRSIKEYIIHFFGAFPREGLQSFFLLISLFMLSLKLACFFILIIAPAFWLIRRLGKFILQRSKQSLYVFSELTEWIQSRLLGIETIKQMRTEKHEDILFQGMLKNFNHIYFKAAKYRAMVSPIIECAAAIALAVILIYALDLTDKDQLTPSVFLSFFATLALLGQSLSKLGKYYNINRQGHAAIEKINDLFQISQELSIQEKFKITTHQSSNSKLEVKNISFQYPETDDVIFRNISYEFLSGNIYCIIGKTGIGKTTFLKTLMGIYPISSGEIIYSGPPSSSIYLSQDMKIIAPTIALQITYPETEINQEKINSVLEKVSLLSFVENLPQKLDTMMNLSSFPLSGGQLQKLHLARILYHDSSFVFIDEGTSALDPDFENLFEQHLKKLAEEGRVIIMISHRSKTMSYAHHVLDAEKLFHV